MCHLSDIAETKAKARAGARGHPKVLVKIVTSKRVAAPVAATSTRVSLEKPDWFTMWSRFLIASVTSATAPTRIRCPATHPTEAPKAPSRESWKPPVPMKPGRP